MKGFGKKNALEKISVSSHGNISINNNLATTGDSVDGVRAGGRAGREHDGDLGRGVDVGVAAVHKVAHGGRPGPVKR